ncbi:MAG: hypothetical protein ACKVI4_15415 [Actinomycetales bacterium]
MEHYPGAGQGGGLDAEDPQEPEPSNDDEPMEDAKPDDAMVLSASADLMAKRMGISPGQYAQGREFALDAVWRAQLIGPELADDEGHWLTHQYVFKHMLFYPAHQPTAPSGNRPFSGSLWRLRFLLNKMEKDARFSPYFPDPIELLGGVPGQEDVVEAYRARFPRERVEWFGKILSDVIQDFGTPGPTPIAPGQMPDTYGGFGARKLLTFHDVTIRMYSVCRNAMVFFAERNSPFALDAYEKAQLLAYALTQYHIDEWELSAAERVREVDVHVARGPFKARYRLPKVTRVRLLLTEMAACPFCEPFLFPTYVPPETLPEVRALMPALRARLDVPSGKPVQMTSLHEIQHKLDIGQYDLRDPWPAVKADLRACLLGFRLWYAQHERAAPPPWTHPLFTGADAATSYTTLLRMLTLVETIFLKGWPGGGRVGLAALPVQRSRIALLSRLDDHALPPRAGDPGGDPEVERQIASRKEQVAMGKLIEMVSDEGRRRFALYATQHLPAEAFSRSEDGDTLTIEAQYWTWRMLRRAFVQRGIITGTEVAERTRDPDGGRAGYVWQQPDDESTEPAATLDARDAAFRRMAHDMVAQEEAALDASALLRAQRRELDMARQQQRRSRAAAMYEGRPGFPLPDR